MGDPVKGKLSKNMHKNEQVFTIITSTGKRALGAGEVLVAVVLILVLEVK